MEFVTVKQMDWTLDPNFWHFLRKEGAYYLWVNCEQSFVSYSVLLSLNAEEYTEYHAIGRNYLQYLAERINYWPSQYADRRLSGALEEEADKAIRAYLALEVPAS